MTAPLRIDPAGHPDDELHPPTSDDLSWGETSWWAFSVPERDLAVWFYPLIRTNQRVVSAAVFAWDGTGDTPWDCRYFKQFWHLPMPEGPLSDCTFGNGISYQVLEPRMAYRLRYHDPDAVADVEPAIAIDVTFRAVMEPLHTKTSGPDGGHLDQLGRYTGTLVLDGETIAVDSFGARDRSWGPRTPFGPYLMATHGYTATRMPYSHATSETSSFLCISANLTDDFPVIMGFTQFDGEVSRLASGRRSVLAVDERGAPTRVLIEGVDELGRALHAEGECRTRFVNSCNENLVGWNHLVRWEVNGVEAWGEHHENYSMSALRRDLRTHAGW